MTRPVRYSGPDVRDPQQRRAAFAGLTQRQNRVFEDEESWLASRFGCDVNGDRLPQVSDKKAQR